MPIGDSRWAFLFNMANKTIKQRLGQIADSFGGLTGQAVKSLKGQEVDPKTKVIKKSKRQQMLDET